MIVDKIKKRETKNIRPSNKVDIQVGKWVKCDKCKEIIYKDNLKENNKVCPLCGHYFRVSSKRRIEQIIDKGTFEEFDLNIDTVNPLQLEDYEKKIHIHPDNPPMLAIAFMGTTTDSQWNGYVGQWKKLGNTRPQRKPHRYNGCNRC